MKYKNLSEGTIIFDLASGVTATYGALYQINASGKAELLTSAPTSNIVGVAMGGDHVEVDRVFLDIDPTSVFKETYTGSAPTIGAFADSATTGVKLVIGVNTEDKTYSYLIRYALAD